MKQLLVDKFPKEIPSHSRGVEGGNSFLPLRRANPCACVLSFVLFLVFLLSVIHPPSCVHFVTRSKTTEGLWEILYFEARVHTKEKFKNSVTISWAKRNNAHFEDALVLTYEACLVFKYIQSVINREDFRYVAGRFEILDNSFHHKTSVLDVHATSSDIFTPFRVSPENSIQFLANGLLSDGWGTRKCLDRYDVYGNCL